MTTVEITYHESPAVFPSEGEELYGILTTPAGASNGLTVIHVNGKGPSASTVGRGRISVLLTRALAAGGYTGFRVDWRGSGESTGVEREWDLTDLPVQELLDALAWLRSQGLDRVILVGTCGGARSVLETAAVADGLAGVALLNMPVRDYDKDKRFESLSNRQLLRRLFRRQTARDLLDADRRRRYLSRLWRRLRLSRRPSGIAGPRVLQALQELQRRQVPVVFFYGSDDDDYRDWVEASRGPLHAVLSQDGSAITTHVVPGRYYDRSSRQLTGELVEVIGALAGPASQP